MPVAREKKRRTNAADTAANDQNGHNAPKDKVDPGRRPRHQSWLRGLVRSRAAAIMDLPSNLWDAFEIPPRRAYRGLFKNAEIGENNRRHSVCVAVMCLRHFEGAFR